jgi:long-chain fatty acid transport protein
MTSRARSLIVALAVAASALVAARPCLASGFLVYDLSGMAMARGSAVTADDVEPAAIWFNPAFLTDLPGVSASAGGVFITSQASFSPAGGGAETESDRGNFFLPTVYATGRLTDILTVGVGVYSAFGIGIRWPDDWVGREAIIHASLDTLTFNPTVAARVNRQVSVAIGVDAIRSTTDQTLGLPTLVGGQVRLAAGTWGFGVNLAAVYKIVPQRLQVGLTYRSRASLDFQGNANFMPANPDFQPSLPTQPAKASITLPDIISLGVMGRPRSDLALSFDANIVLWSTFDQINITFPSAPTRVMTPNGMNTFTLRAGGDWTFPPKVPGLHLRGGLIYDHTAIPSTNLGPSLPDADRFDIALGAGYSLGHFRGDLGYLLVLFLPHDSTTGQEGPVGTYRTIAQLVGLTLSATWP